MRRPCTGDLIDGYALAGGRFTPDAMDAWAAFRLFAGSVDPFRDRARTGPADMSRHIHRAWRAGPMNWLPPVPKSAVDNSGRTWQVHRAWPDKTPGDYIAGGHDAGRAGVRAAHLRSGHFELVPQDDPGLPALRAEARRGEIISHRPHARAVIRAAGCYIKVFRPGEALVPAERCRQVGLLLDAGTFSSPTVLRSSADVIVFSSLPGRTLGELGQDHTTVSDESFARMWEKWSQAWTAQVGGRYDTARSNTLATLPVHSPEVEAADLQRWVNRWLRHYENVPEASPHARCFECQGRGRHAEPAPDGTGSAGLGPRRPPRQADPRRRRPSPLGLLDFDDTAQAEAALDLANLDVHLELHRTPKPHDAGTIPDGPHSGTGRG